MTSIKFSSLKQTDSQESMTGYSVIEKTIANRLFRFHLKSINNRFFELKWRAPKDWFALELPIKSLFQGIFSRGSFDFTVEEVPDSTSAKRDEKHHVQNLLLHLQDTLKSVKGISSWTLPSFVQAMILSRHPEYWMPKHLDQKMTFEEVQPALLELADSLKKIRRDEGYRVALHLTQCLDVINKEWEAVTLELPKLQVELEEQFKKRMEESFSKFSVETVEQQRLASEIALLMEKRDCSEEMERIRMHLEALHECLESQQSNIGKRVDFMAQELLREWTTLGSKVRHHKVFHHTLNAKLEIEKIREQSMNLS